MPLAPAAGLYLAECLYYSYERKWCTGPKRPLLRTLPAEQRGGEMATVDAAAAPPQAKPKVEAKAAATEEREEEVEREMWEEMWGSDGEPFGDG